MDEKSINATELFSVTVNGMENMEWQGAVEFSGGKEARFSSLIELVRLVQDRSQIQTPEWVQEEDK